MSDLHDRSERPQQYRVPCEQCGKREIDGLRMHSHLRSRHLQRADIEAVPDETYVQCNNCGEIRTV